MKSEYYDFGNSTYADGYNAAQSGRHIEITAGFFKQAVIFLIGKHGRTQAQNIDLAGMRVTTQGYSGIGMGQYRAIPCRGIVL